MGTKKRKLNPFMEFMAKFRLENKGKGWSVVEMAKEGGKEWRGRNGTGTARKGKKTRGGSRTARNNETNERNERKNHNIRYEYPTNERRRREGGSKAEFGTNA